MFADQVAQTDTGAYMRPDCGYPVPTGKPQAIVRGTAFLDKAL